jgi:hypothetical protein
MAKKDNTALYLGLAGLAGLVAYMIYGRSLAAGAGTTGGTATGGATGTGGAILNAAGQALSTGTQIFQAATGGGGSYVLQPISTAAAGAPPAKVEAAAPVNGVVSFRVCVGGECVNSSIAALKEVSGFVSGYMFFAKHYGTRVDFIIFDKVNKAQPIYEYQFKF